MSSIQDDVKAGLQLALGDVRKLRTIDSQWPAWVGNLEGAPAVLIESATAGELDLHFASVRLYSSSVEIDSSVRRVLVLSCNQSALLDLFSYISVSFVDPGVDGTLRRGVIQNPAHWWLHIQELIGNTVSNPIGHGILGEMLVYSRLLEHGHNVQWQGPDKAHIDLISPTYAWEVKSTLRHSESLITISSENQLADRPQKTFLVLCRFECVPGGALTIAGVSQELVARGAAPAHIESKLRKAGLSPGHPHRGLGFNMINDPVVYEVGAEFPLVRRSELNERVTAFSYTLNLSGLPAVTLTEHLGALD